MEFYKNQLCISYAELTAGDPLAVDPLKRPILSESNFKYYKKTGKLQVLNRACYGTPALVLYASLPDSVKQEVEARKELKQVRKQLRQKIDSLENTLIFVNMALMPLLVILAGIVVAVVRHRRGARR